MNKEGNLIRYQLPHSTGDIYRNRTTSISLVAALGMFLLGLLSGAVFHGSGTSGSQRNAVGLRARLISIGYSRGAEISSTPILRFSYLLENTNGTDYKGAITSIHIGGRSGQKEKALIFSGVSIVDPGNSILLIPAHEKVVTQIELATGQQLAEHTLNEDVMDYLGRAFPTLVGFTAFDDKNHVKIEFPCCVAENGTSPNVPTEVSDEDWDDADVAANCSSRDVVTAYRLDGRGVDISLSCKFRNLQHADVEFPSGRQMDSLLLKSAGVPSKSLYLGSADAKIGQFSTVEGGLFLGNPCAASDSAQHCVDKALHSSRRILMRDPTTGIRYRISVDRPEKSAYGME